MPIAMRGVAGDSQQKRAYTVDSGSTLTDGFGVVQGALDSSVQNPTAPGQLCAGVVEYAPFGASLTASIIRKGECGAVCSAAINAGQWVKMDATGQFVPSSTPGDNVAGRAVTSTQNAGDYFVLDVDPFVL